MPVSSEQPEHSPPLKLVNKDYSFLHQGATFKGHQRSSTNEYALHLQLIDIDLENSYFNGYLDIHGLLNDQQTLKTFFECEIIGSKYGFLKTCKENDLKHWSLFDSFCFQDFIEFDLKKDILGRYLYFRLKEVFLVPDHTVKSVEGCSYDGFYYMCMDLKMGKIEGCYYYKESEMFQRLVVDYYGGHKGSWEFN